MSRCSSLTHAAVHPTNHWYRWMFIPTYINIYSNMVVQKSYIYILEWDTNIGNDIGYELPHFHIQPWYVLTHTQYHSEIPFRNPMIFPRDLLGELSTFQRHGRDLQGRLRRRIGHQPSTPHLDVIQDPEGTGLKPVDMENAEHEQIAMHVPRNILCISEKCVCTLAIEIHMYICSYVYMYIYIYHILYQKNKSSYIYIVWKGLKRVVMSYLQGKWARCFKVFFRTSDDHLNDGSNLCSWYQWFGHVHGLQHDKSWKHDMLYTIWNAICIYIYIRIYVMYIISISYIYKYLRVYIYIII